MSRASFKLWKTFSAISQTPSSVADSIRVALEEFKPHVALVEVLCNPGLRQRHWGAISGIVGFDMRPDDHTTLTRFIEMGVAKWIEPLTEISDAAR